MCSRRELCISRMSSKPRHKLTCNRREIAKNCGVNGVRVSTLSKRLKFPHPRSLVVCSHLVMPGQKCWLRFFGLGVVAAMVSNPDQDGEMGTIDTAGKLEKVKTTYLFPTTFKLHQKRSFSSCRVSSESQQLSSSHFIWKSYVGTQISFFQGGMTSEPKNNK